MVPIFYIVASLFVILEMDKHSSLMEKVMIFIHFIVLLYLGIARTLFSMISMEFEDESEKRFAFL